MNDYYLNRLNMGRKVYACLDSKEHTPLWKGQEPPALEKAIDAGRVMLAGLEKLAQDQGKDTTGSAADKAREEKELEDAAHVLGRLVVQCCRAAGDETTAATYDLPISGWRRMRDEGLLQTARSLEAKAAELAATPAGAEYGITAARVATLNKEADDYAALIAAPDDAIGSKAAVTNRVRPAFADFENQLQIIDDLLLPLRATETGALLVAKYEQARTINDRGRRPGKDDTPPPAEPAK